MHRRLSSRTAIWSVVATAAIVLAIAATPAPAQDSDTPAKAAPAKAKKFHGRLPAYYTAVVDDKQRQAIYDIQEEYAPKIDVLQAQLKALLQERNEKVEAVLTAEQIAKIQAARAAAAAKRAQNAAPKAPPKKPAAEKASSSAPRP